MSHPWPEGVRFGDEGLTFRGRTARDLVARYGTPLVLVDETVVRERCRSIAEAFGRALWAVKAFPAGALIRIAHEEGLGLLAATGGEVDACLRAGVPASRVVLHGNNKTDAELRLAVGAGVGLLILDNEEEVGRVADVGRAHGVRQPVLVRVVPGLEVDTHEAVATGVVDTKFGVPMPLALRVLRLALEAPELDLRGIHLHLGSQLLDASPHEAAIDVALDLLVEARRELGWTAETLDLGGGMGVAYTDERALDLRGLAATVRSRVVDGAAARGLEPPEVVVEPGRAVTAPAALTLYTVGAIKEVPGVRTYVAVDGGMSDNLRPALYGSRYTMALASRRSDAEARPATVVGRHCESGDILARDVPLPSDLRRDDLLAVAGTGAYEYAMSSNYNKVGRPAVVLATETTDRAILRREDAGDLARLELPTAPRPAAPRPAGVEVRPARVRDARSLARMVESVAAEGRFIRTEGPITVRETRRRLRVGWSPDHAELVAVADGAVVGHLGIGRTPHAGTRHVASLGMAVAAPWRGRGVGSALLGAAFDWARWAGVEKLSLEVYPHNTVAMALYRKFGFVEEGRLRAHSKKRGTYEDEIVMGAWV
ncbi:MAG TPA: diaminopimelate decarboxylase [Actinomycetota bacterium]|nr:diaminopimelate decarboxylase [Actinomycetota bacterium]